MTELYIHIGMGKTGTTTLQTFFWANRNALKSAGILYPKLGAVAGAHHLLSPHHPPFLKNVWNFIPASEWAAELEKQADRPVLLSSELISSAAPEVVHQFANDLKGHFDTKIIIYLRRQDNLLAAGYNQQVKAGTQVLDIQSAMGIILKRQDFKERIEVWSDAFGAENMRVRAYERGQFLHGDIRRDFLSGVFGVDDFSKFSFASGNENPRFTYSALEYKRYINNVIGDTQASTVFNEPLLAYSAAVDKGATALFHESELLSGTERQMILNRCRDTNEWIARDLMGRADGQLFKEPIPEDDKDWLPPKVSDEEFAKIGAFLREKGFDRKLRAAIDTAMKENRFEAYRYCRDLLRSLEPAKAGWAWPTRTRRN